MTPEEQGELLRAWLQSPPGSPIPAELDADVVEAVLALRPDLAPAPRVSVDDILRDRLESAANRPAVGRRRSRWMVLAGTGGVGLIAAMFLVAIGLPALVSRTSEPVMELAPRPEIEDGEAISAMPPPAEEPVRPFVDEAPAEKVVADKAATKAPPAKVEVAAVPTPLAVELEADNTLGDPGFDLVEPALGGTVVAGVPAEGLVGRDDGSEMAITGTSTPTATPVREVEEKRPRATKKSPGASRQEKADVQGVIAGAQPTDYVAPDFGIDEKDEVVAVAERAGAEDERPGSAADQLADRIVPPASIGQPWAAEAARLYLEQGEAAKAADTCRRGLALGNANTPARAQLLWLYGLALTEIGRDSEAAEAWRQAARLNAER